MAPRPRLAATAMRRCALVGLMTDVAGTATALLLLIIVHTATLAPSAIWALREPLLISVPFMAMLCLVALFVGPAFGVTVWPVHIIFVVLLMARHWPDWAWRLCAAPLSVQGLPPFLA